MAFIKTEKVAIRGISGCVPSQVEENITLPFYASEQEAQKVIETIGIERRHIAPENVTASDLCLKAASKLIEDLGWEKESIDLIAFCTQTPDYVNHPNSFVIHEELGLPESTVCLDFYHGCPGWVTSLSTVSQMIGSGQIKRALLLDGDTVSRWQDRANRESVPLFGDAGTATALEYDPEAAPIYFNIGTKSDDGRAIAAKDGGFRHPYTRETFDKHLNSIEGKLQDIDDVNKMESMDVFSFAITKVPKAIKRLCSNYSIDMENVDMLTLHQANKLIVETIAKRLKMPAEKVMIGLKEYGNTTSASVPMAIISEASDRIKNGHVCHLTCAFGTGLAWGAAYFETNNIVCPPIQEI